MATCLFIQNNLDITSMLAYPKRSGPQERKKDMLEWIKQTIFTSPPEVLGLIVGLIVGSFLNVVIYRIPKILEREWLLNLKSFSETQETHQENKETLFPKEPFNLCTPASHCLQCHTKIKWWGNIPIVSWIMQRSRCTYCKTKISMRYPLIEALTGFLFAIALNQFGITWYGLGAIIFTAFLIAMTFIDWDTQLLPDNMTLPLLWIGLLFNSQSVFCDANQSIIGAAIGYLSLWLVYWIFKIATGKEGMGYGDFKLLGAIGAWFGWQSLPSVIIFSSFTGSIVGVSLLFFFKHKRDEPIPFGPYLAIAGLLCLYFPNPLELIFPF